MTAKKIFIKDIKANTEIKGIFLLATVNQQQARNGPFWRIELKDNSGSLEGRVWSPTAQNYTDLQSGTLAEIDGRADVFREQIQISINHLRVLSSEEAQSVNLADFIPSSAIAAELMLEELKKKCKKEISQPNLSKLCSLILNDEDVRSRLLTAPAAKSIHHAWAGGLLEHILSVLKLCMNIAELYPQIDRQILIVGAILHDFGKMWELSGGLSNDYTTEGRLIGHINISLEKLEPFFKKSGLEPEYILHLKHLILSHHGEYEYGSPRLPQTAEAFVLHHADNIDAKLNQFNSLFAEADEGVWSPYQSSLQRALFNAPSIKNKEKQEIKPKEEQCLLPLKA